VHSDVIYFLILSLLFCFLLWLVYWRSQKRQYPTTTALNLSLVIMLAGFVGARMMHVFYEETSFYLSHPEFILAFWAGGFVFYGGFLLALAVVAFLVRRHWFYWADFWAPILALGYGLGRGACLWTGCCYGKFCQLPWAIHGRHPTQLYAMAYELFIWVGLFFLEKILIKKNLFGRGILFFSWLGLHSIGRIMMEFFRDDNRGEFIAGLSISSWISILLLLISAGFFLVLRTKREAFFRHYSK
jgi:phosphatidylglycerol---prolipoprotein diacylglyceryl transferase